jgi:hypothetical protein
VEIIVLPIVDEKSRPKLTRKMIDEMLVGSITQSLIGTIPCTDMSLDEIRSERLYKYESIN